MKPKIKKDGGSWVVRGGNPVRTVRVASYEAALVVAAGPTGREKRCLECGRPMARENDRPLGVLSQKTSGYCGSCVHADFRLSKAAGEEWRKRQAERRERNEAERKRNEAERKRQQALRERTEHEQRLKEEREAVARAERNDPSLAHYLARRRARLGVAA